MESVTFSSSVNEFGNNVFNFSGCSSTVEFPVTKSGVPPKTGGNFYSVKLAEGYTCTGSEWGTVLKEIYLPSTITEISSYAFNGCKNLTSIDLPSNLNKIGEGAFLGCSGLKSIIVPENVTEIVQDAFMDCTGLQKVEFKGSLETLSRREFAGCTSLKTIVFPKNLKSIGVGCFFDCDALTDITVPEGVEAVYGGAFSNCENLKSISLPVSLKTLSYGAHNGKTNTDNSFHDNPALQKFSVATGNSTFASYDGCIYNKALTELFFIPTGKKMLLIPESVTSISQYAFFNDDGYSGTSIHFRGNLTNSYPDSVLDSVTTTAYYPAGNSTWSQSAREKLGGTIVWKEWHPNITDCTITISPTSYTYDGKEKKPTVTVKDGTETLVLNTDYTVSYTNNINAGKATAKLSGKNRYSGTKSVQFTINKAAPVLKFASSNISKKTTDAAFTNTLTKTTDGSVSFKSSKTSVATVDSSGKVTIEGEGTTTITANATEGTNYKTGSASYTLTVVKDSIDISGCTVTLSTTSYTYDGKEKKPAVTVKDGTKTLSLNTAYTVAYENNTNAGKATVKVTGKGDYTGTKSVQFTINKAAPVLKFESASVTKNPSDAAFTNKLTKTTDGTVTFKSSKTSVATVNSTSGKVSIKGEGQTTITATATAGTNYNAGTTSYTLTVEKLGQGFTWGKDNWGFINSDLTGDFSSAPYISQIDSNYKSVLASNLTNDEYQYIFNPWDGWLYDYWGGSCYGMSSLTLLSMKGLLPYAKYQTGATCLNNLKCPTANSKVSSLITYYQMIQVKEPIQQQYRTVPMKGNKENISRIITLLNSNDTVLIGFQKSGWGGHAILAYGYEYGSYSWSGVTYQGCIKICDPNSSSAYDKKNNIYFNSSSFNWTIPAYTNMTSSKGAVFNYVGANTSEINNGGYLSRTNSYTSDNFVARIDAVAISDDRSITKVRNVNGNYVKQNNAADDIVEAESFILGASGSKGTIGYNLYDASSSYKVSQDAAEELKLKMDYGGLVLKAESSAGHYAIFDKKGYVEVSGESADYAVGMTLNENYPTKWFNVEALGSGANTVSMLKKDNGYLLSGDHFSNVQVRANNRDEWVSTTFTTNKNKALICETNKGELDVRVDNDNNGTYETSVTVKKKLFSDVQDPNHAYYKAIYWAADAGITKGYPDGTFGINKSCTRGEMIMFLWRYAGKPVPKAVSASPFKDVAKNHAFYNAILWASQTGITKGYPDGTFGIDRNVSRGECMMFLWRLKGKPAPKAVSESPFKDVPKSHAFYNAILWGYQKKITTGYTSGAKKGTFGIDENCTRGAIVTFLYRAK